MNWGGLTVAVSVVAVAFAAHPAIGVIALLALGWLWRKS